MNLFKIVQKRTSKRKQNDSPYQEVGAVLLFVFLLPYVISCLWGHVGEETEVLAVGMEKETNYLDAQYEVVLSGEWGTRTLTMEEYLIQKLILVMPIEENGISYEGEALKAQAVLLRTEVWKLVETDNKANITGYDIRKYDKEINMSPEQMNLYEEAVHETDGIILSYQGEAIKAAYFTVSNGQTRDAEQVWGSGSYPYLKTVECKQDILAENYQSQVCVEKENFYQIMSETFDVHKQEQIVWGELELCFDDVGYVTKVKTNDMECSGEAFRYAFGLNSACFEMEWKEDEVIFHVKGVGHGFGMSQYGANMQAAEGKRFDEILENYFFQAELVKIE
ncbi:MAG: SpoIID/LytB domain-containing protein [Lachnospiraceae bacterium]|nr:SpoIID/LytB domain-containing protein [Lachnospiraceae bacterium]